MRQRAVAHSAALAWEHRRELHARIRMRASRGQSLAPILLQHAIPPPFPPPAFQNTPPQLSLGVYFGLTDDVKARRATTPRARAALMEAPAVTAPGGSRRIIL